MTTTTEEKEPERVRPFADLLLELDKGSIHDELSEKLRAITAAVQTTGRKGSITLTVNLAPFKGNPDILTVAATVSVKTPKTDPKEQVFYPTKDGNLVRDDPAQMHLPLREVSTPDPTENLRSARG